MNRISKFLIVLIISMSATVSFAKPMWGLTPGETYIGLDKTDVTPPEQNVPPGANKIASHTSEVDGLGVAISQSVASTDQVIVSQQNLAYTQSDYNQKYVSACKAIGESTSGSSGKNYRRDLVSTELNDISISMFKNGNRKLKGLQAMFDVYSESTFTKKNGKEYTKRVKLGKVRVFGRNNGSFGIWTRGRIKKKHITSISNDMGVYYEKDGRNRISGKEFRNVIKYGNSFTINLNGLDLLHKTKTGVDGDYEIRTVIESYVSNVGNGTATEINIGETGDDLSVAEMIENGIPVPEPATLILLSASSLLLLRRKKR